MLCFKEKDAETLSMNSVFGGVKATQEADNVLIIQQKTLHNLQLKKFLQVRVPSQFASLNTWQAYLED